jgi:ATP-binding cassette subfamily B (MDR/TAP) protein 1
MEFFDRRENTPSVIASGISSNSTKASGLVSIVIRVVVEAVSLMILGMIISFLAAPKLAAVMVSTFPVLLTASGISMAAWMGVDSQDQDQGPKKKMIQIVSETFANMKTIRSLGCEEKLINNLAILTDEQYKTSLWRTIKSGIAFGVAMGVNFFANSLGYWYGGILVSRGEINVTQMTRAILGPMMTSLGIGEALAFLPDVGQSIDAARQIIELIDMTPDNKGKCLVVDNATTRGWDIDFVQVDFRYPSRPDMPVLNRLTLRIPRGKKVALVGPSGSGKSTIFSLLQRFYPVENGAIRINGVVDIEHIDKTEFRSHIGYVGQEPVLFDMSLEDNVLYGIDGLSDGKKKEMLESLKEKANLDFVYNGGIEWSTPLGARGSRISGGQKQRVAIARALAIDPDVLLFDEATSALDTVSERIIQTAVDEMIEDHKSVVLIAHRLSTVVNADLIYVISKGQVVESGTHASLVANEDSLYTHLYRSGL